MEDFWFSDVVLGAVRLRSCLRWFVRLLGKEVEVGECSSGNISNLFDVFTAKMSVSAVVFRSSGVVWLSFSLVFFVLTIFAVFLSRFLCWLYRVFICSLIVLYSIVMLLLNCWRCVFVLV